MITINETQALEALKHIVEEKGADFRYQILPCKYAVDGVPSCGVGQALAHLGVPLPTVIALDTANTGTSLAARAMRPFLKSENVDLTSGAAEVLEAFQSVQDYGSRNETATWGAALANATERFNKLTSSEV